jgi:GDP-L-fucose synthase
VTYSHINVGSEEDISILELAQMVENITGYSCRVVTDATKPDGAPRKLMEVTRLKSIGWQAKIALEDGVSETYSWFLQNNQSLRG